MEQVNLAAVVTAALSSFLLGGLWYSRAAFGGIWNRENGSTEQKGHAARVFAASFGFTLLAAFAFAWQLGPAPPLHVALARGILAGFGFVAASFGINYQFAQRSFKLWLIDGGYHTAQFVLFGLVVGAFG